MHLKFLSWQLHDLCLVKVYRNFNIVFRSLGECESTCRYHMRRPGEGGAGLPPTRPGEGGAGLPPVS